MIGACNYPKIDYRLEKMGDEIPDSMVNDATDFIKELVKGTNQNLTTSDYEDPEDVIREAGDLAYRVYGKPKIGLMMVVDRCFFCAEESNFIEVKYLTADQKEIFDSLKTGW